ELRHRYAAEALHGLLDAPAHRGDGVVAEVVLVALVHAFEQQLQFDVENGVHAASIGTTWASRRGTATPACPRLSAWRCSRWRRPPGSCAGRRPWPWRSGR